MKVKFGDPHVRQHLGDYWHIEDGNIVVVFFKDGHGDWCKGAYLRMGDQDIDNKQIMSQRDVLHYEDHFEEYEGYPPSTEMAQALFDTTNHERVEEITAWWLANSDRYDLTFEEEAAI